MQLTTPNLRADAHTDKPSSDAKPASINAKERSALIAKHHGIHSTEPVIDGVESLEEWIAHRDTVVVELNPVGKLETAYAERAALYLWRLDRVVRYEITATQFDLEDVVQEFMHSLDHPDLPRDRSEAVTLEKIRAPLGDFLNQFAKWGEVAAKLPGQKEGLADVRGEMKRIKERRILPDQPTIQTIVKYEAHLNSCLARTMTELRRLQKERRQGLREIEDTENTRANASNGESSGGAAAVPTRQACMCQNKDHEDGSPGGSLNRDQDNFQCEDGSPGRHGDSPSRIDSTSQLDSSSQIDSMNQMGSTSQIDSPIGMDSPGQLGSTIQLDSPVHMGSSSQNPLLQPMPESKHSLISESTPQGIVTRERNASGVMITMFPQTQYSANPNVIVRPASTPIIPRQHH